MTKYFLILAMIAYPAIAAPDTVEAMRVTYANTFREVPPSRKCKAADAKGPWKSIVVLQVKPDPKTVEQEKIGPHYLGFADHSRLVSLRSKDKVDVRRIKFEASNAFLQYIMTDAGMLYIYQNGALQSSLLCYVSTSPSQKYQSGLLMLAVPVEKDKALSMTLYEPIK